MNSIVSLKSLIKNLLSVIIGLTIFVLIVLPTIPKTPFFLAVLVIFLPFSSTPSYFRPSSSPNKNSLKFVEPATIEVAKPVAAPKIGPPTTVPRRPPPSAPVVAIERENLDSEFLSPVVLLPLDLLNALVKAFFTLEIYPLFNLFCPSGSFGSISPNKNFWKKFDLVTIAVASPIMAPPIGPPTKAPNIPPPDNPSAPEPNPKAALPAKKFLFFLKNFCVAALIIPPSRSPFKSFLPKR